MSKDLTDFLDLFSREFNPPTPYRGQSGKTWYVSRVWSKYMKGWLRDHSSVQLEYPAPNRTRLDAALWFGATHAGSMDVALEWEWDDSKVLKDFHQGDFKKLFEVDAKSGLAIVQTRVDGRRGTAKADRTLQLIRAARSTHRCDDRPIALIEFRRIYHDWRRVEFSCSTVGLANGYKTELRRLHYSAATV